MTIMDYVVLSIIVLMWIAVVAFLLNGLLEDVVSLVPAMLLGVLASFSTYVFIHRNDPPTPAQQRTDAFEAGEVQEVARSPDGVVLWRVKVNGQTVYFSSTGTRWDTTRACGTVKAPSTCTERHEVPNAQ